MNPMVANLEKLLAGGKDGALLRYTLGKAYADEEQWAQALAHLQQAVAQDANYSVAWKQLGKVQLALDDAAGARDASDAAGRLRLDPAPGSQHRRPESRPDAA